MTAKPPHHRRLGLTGIALTEKRNNPLNIRALSEVRDDIEKLLADSGYLENAPFHWVTIALRYGLKNDDVPGYQKIDTEFGDLPLSIEIDSNELRGASPEELKAMFSTAVLKALIHAGEKYNRPDNALVELREMVSRAGGGRG